MYEEQRDEKRSKWKRNIMDSRSAGTKNLGLVKAIFIPLGWLVEHERQELVERFRVTNYVILINVTTRPMSLWLAYDYHFLDEDCCLTVRSLKNSDYPNPAYGVDYLKLDIRKSFDISTPPTVR